VKVQIDTDRCTGHGRCYVLAPEVFDADDRGNGVVLLDGPIPEALVDQARRAVANCPEQAVLVTE